MVPITPAVLTAVAPFVRGLSPVVVERRSTIINGVAPELERQFMLNKIDTPLRAAHFLAQAAHETDGFKTLEEYANGHAYEGREDLGNGHPGDGPRYKGRGIFQITGRANYREIGGRLDAPLEEQPELLLQPKLAVGAAVEFWLKHVLSYYADRDDIVHITRAINGGLSHLESRKAYLVRARTALGI